MKEGWSNVPVSVFVDPSSFVEAVRAYETAFNRKVVVEKCAGHDDGETLWATIDLEEISNHCRLYFHDPMSFDNSDGGGAFSQTGCMITVFVETETVQKIVTEGLKRFICHTAYHSTLVPLSIVVDGIKTIRQKSLSPDGQTLAITLK
jgi:hypothetical protein